MELHPLQVQIAMRGISLLKVGGIMAYSTCTFNPIENEAVVSELLRRCGESIKILKCKLEGFKCGDGISHWPVYDDQMREWTLEEFIKTSSDRRKEAHILSEKMPPISKTMFPSNQKRLSRCLRVFPHYNNTGGFFVCLLKKVKPLTIFPKPAKAFPVSMKIKAQMEKCREQSRTKNGQIYRPLPDEMKKSILNKFNNNITRRGQLYSRSATFKQIYLASASLSKFCFGSPGAGRLHIVNAGTLVFQKKREYSMEDASYKDADEYEPYRKLMKRVRKALA